MHAAFPEAQVSGIAHLIDLAAHGAVVRQLDQGIAHHHMIVLVRAHEAAQHHLAGQGTLVGQDAGFGGIDDGSEAVQGSD